MWMMSSPRWFNNLHEKLADHHCLETDKFYRHIQLLILFIIYIFPSNVFAGSRFSKIADTSTLVPDGTGTFSTFLAPAVSGNYSAFLGFDQNGIPGLYTGSQGNIAVIADDNTAIPGGSGAFTSFGFSPALSGTNTTFQASGASVQQGIYASIGGTLGVVADTHTAIPGGSGAFTSFDTRPSIYGTNSVFLGFGAASQQGIYTNIGGILGVVADTHTAIPGGSGTFTLFDTPSLYGNSIVFDAFGNNGYQGIYIDTNGILTDVVDTNGVIDNKTPVSFTVIRGGFDGKFNCFRCYVQ